MIAWRPHTEQPRQICTAVVAVRFDPEFEDDAGFALLPTIFTWHPAAGWTDERTDEPLLYREFFWLPEAELLAPFEAAASAQGVEP